MRNIIFVLLLLINGFATSAIFQVNLTVQDHVDDNPGDGVCDIPTGGFCTLRAAVMEANASPGADVIVLPGDSTINLSINGSFENAAASGDLDITEAVTIGAFTEDTADYPNIDATSLDDRVFHVLSGSGVVTFVNMRITNGSSDFSNGGAINISINNQVEVNRVWFEDNTADSGGAIYLSPLSDLTVIDSVFRGNAAVSQGGAMTLFSPTEIQQTTVFENLNFNNEFQEAIFVGLDAFGTSSLTIRNSTVFDNSNTGVYALEADLSIRNSTIVYNIGRGIMSNPSQKITPEVRMRNSIFAGNQQGNCAFGNVNEITNNWNLTSDVSCFQTGSTNLIEIDPKLANLRVDLENWHRYFRPGFFSPVVDSAHPATPGPGIGCEGEDQLGVTRPQDSYADGNDRCDRGAIELSADIIYFDEFDISYSIAQ